MRLIKSTLNGQIFICPCQNKLHLEFGNLFLILTYDEFNYLNDYVRGIDYKHYLTKNQNAQNRRKLLLHFGLKGAFLALNESEFLEFKELLSLKKKADKLSPVKMNTNDINFN